jgi:hypothetical protein
LIESCETPKPHSQVQLKDVLTPTYMQQHTKFGSIEEMFGKSPATLNSVEDPKTIPGEDRDAYIMANIQAGRT